MNASSDMTSLERERLERRRNQIRSRLLLTVERLDQKRHDLAKLTDVKYQVESHVVPIAATGAIAMVALGALTTLAAVHAFTAPARMRNERAKALKRAWSHPERVGRSRSIFAGLGRTILQGVATTVAFELVKHAMKTPAVSDHLDNATRAVMKRFDIR